MRHVFVLGAVTEQKPLKFALFRRLDEVAPPEVTLATNTSAISITEIAAQTRRPERVIGVRLVRAGRHGRKSGAGFYEYREGQKVPAHA